jgi:GTPase Era involved in 16S rRNA processing
MGNKLKAQPIRIAIAGQAGSGKSTLTNTLIGCAVDGEDECPAFMSSNGASGEYNASGYQTLANSRVYIHDLPGCGTQQHPEGTYAAQWLLEDGEPRYDVVVVVSQQRSLACEKNISVQLNQSHVQNQININAGETGRPSTPVFLVRNRININLGNLHRGTRYKNMDEAQKQRAEFLEFEDAKVAMQDVLHCPSSAGENCIVHCIDARDADKYELPQLRARVASSICSILNDKVQFAARSLSTGA